MMQIAGMAVAIYVVTLMLRLRHDEAQGTLEPVLGTAVSRLRWLGAYAVNALAGAVILILRLRGSDGHHRRPGGRRHCSTAA